jgi:CDGSH-type Zn-finger protein/nucleotide-binding universal stress UspA family protein
VEKDRVEIEVTPDGPYEVTGDLPITPKRMVRSADAEPLTWATEGRLSHDSPTFLCRCGHSEDKPFCDGHHLTVGFDGTETASTEAFMEQSKTYEGTGITVHRVGPICEHASFCANKVTDWYQMLPDTGDTNIRGQVIGMIEHCPSGALVSEIDGEVIEPDIPRAISPVEDGPYWVTGNVTIVRSDGIPLETRNRVTLCRCGASKNKPLCDGTHAKIGFEAKNPVGDSVVESPVEPETSAKVRGVFRRIVLGASGSTTDETFEVTAMVARVASSEVSVVHAGFDGSHAHADEVLAEIVDRAEKAGVAPDRLTSELRPGNPPAALVQAAADVDAGLIIVGRGGGRLSRIPHRVSLHAPCDVLVVASRGADRPERYRRVLIASDGSATADRAARRGFGLARALDVPVDLVFVGHPATGELIVDDTISAYGDGVATEARLLQGKPVKRILEAAAATDADLVVVGNKGMTRTRMLIRTSVPGGVLEGARSDVLLCRTVRQLESELEPGDGGVIERDGEHLAAFVDESGELHLMSARCTHLGCVVAWNPAGSTFDCPCHGSRFGPLGEVVEGPAAKPLRPAGNG